MNKKVTALIILLIICALLGTKLGNMKPMRMAAQKSGDSAQLLLGMIGELRYTLAALMWAKADYYHHEFELTGKNWKANKSLMSLIRMVTILDPHFTQAYDFGAYHLAINLDKYDEAYKFLQEGIKYNPDSFELQWELGFLLYSQKKYKEALHPLLKAWELVDKKSYMDETVLKRVWVVSRLKGCYYELGNLEMARKYCLEWVRIQPDKPLPREWLDLIDTEIRQKSNSQKTESK